jgi:hypothetical protein
VVVLQQDPVEQAHAVILRAPHGGGVLVEAAPARQRLARVDDAGAAAPNALGEAPRQRRHAARAGEEVECGSLAGEKGAQRARHERQRLARSGRRALRGAGLEADVGLDLPEDGQRDRQAADHQILARLDDGATSAVGLHGQRAGEVARADVFGQRETHQRKPGGRGRERGQGGGAHRRRE